MEQHITRLTIERDLTQAKNVNYFTAHHWGGNTIVQNIKYKEKNKKK